MTDAFLACRGVQKHFGATLAVNDADLSIDKHEIAALLGPSGCGKTTLLRLIAGFELPDAGEIELNGRIIASQSRSVPPEKRKVAMVFQDFALFPHLNVGANVAFGLPRGVERRRRVAELLALVRLDGLENRMPHELSGGQQQRVALARALATDPDLILLDEPFSNLDPSVRADVRREVRELMRSVGVTAIIVTHDQEEALSLAGRVAVMMNGSVMQIGTPNEVYMRPVSRQVGEFVGAANFLEGRVQDGVAECELGRFEVKNGFNGPADVMFRAESLTLTEDGGAPSGVPAGVPGEVVDLDYYGHDQMVTVRLASGTQLHIRLLNAGEVRLGQQVGVAGRGEVLAFAREA